MASVTVVTVSECSRRDLIHHLDLPPSVVHTTVEGVDPSLRPGLTFMTLHFQDDVTTNILTIDATDPKSGTAEFKATAIRIEKLEPVPA